jgi:aspartyl-tRNA(Asn)/glutamyl-tRNA(Gln) amidotransferase subunit C
MIQLTPDQVRHIATLARLRLSEEEVTRFTSELTGILQYVEMLGNADTKGVEPTAQVTGQTNALRADEIYATPLASPDALLGTSALPIVEHQIQTPSAHGSA